MDARLGAAEPGIFVAPFGLVSGERRPLPTACAGVGLCRVAGAVLGCAMEAQDETGRSGGCCCDLVVTV
ncbi:hypothetical protein CKO24_12975 [Rhodothalassium salexigens DSM 2132]|nr:hypothetical protein [Rhodothalassium salexigens DSM 2132]